MSLTCCFCRKGLVEEEAGYRSDEHAPTENRAACASSPTGRHEVADKMVRVPVQAATECECLPRTGDPT